MWYWNYYELKEFLLKGYIKFDLIYKIEPYNFKTEITNAIKNKKIIEGGFCKVVELND